MDGGECPGSGNLLPVVSERWARFGAAVFITVVIATVFRAHVVEGAGDGWLPTSEDMVCRRLPRTWVSAASSTVQARARPDSCQAVTAKASVPRAICVTPLPAGVLASPQVFNVTWRRQGRRRSLVACPGDGHGDSRAGLRRSVVMWQRVAVGLIYPNARGAARGRRHGRATTQRCRLGPPLGRG
jgi:hypothetical protein